MLSSEILQAESKIEIEVKIPLLVRKIKLQQILNYNLKIITMITIPKFVQQIMYDNGTVINKLKKNVIILLLSIKALGTHFYERIT